MNIYDSKGRTHGVKSSIYVAVGSINYKREALGRLNAFLFASSRGIYAQDSMAEAKFKRFLILSEIVCDVLHSKVRLLFLHTCFLYDHVYMLA